MKQYRLGPNGGILTSLNLFATKVDQIVSLVEKRTAPPSPPPVPSSSPSSTTTATATSTPTDTEIPRPKPISHILIDTPGQIEVFVWSASGSILLDGMASSVATVLAYVVDTPRTASTATFMSNMLYACSILYKTRLPMILVFNKTDVTDAAFAREWMVDFEAFQEALRREEVESGGGAGEGGGAGGGSGYMGSLLNSMSLVLEEFYRHLSVVAVSAVTGAGVGEFFEAVEGKRREFERDYRPELERRRGEREREKVVRREEELGRLMRDVHVEAESEGAGKSANGMGRARKAAEMEMETKTAGGEGKGKGRRKREPETISDIESSSSSDNAGFRHNDNDNDEDDDEEEEEEVPAQLVDPDSSDQDHDNDDDEREENADGLTQRYRRALADESGVGGGGAGGEEKGGGKRAETEEMAKVARYLKAGGV